MADLWYAVLSLTLTLYVVLDGWTIGAGMLHFVVARNERERRQVVAALGPLWSWYEVWLLAAGGILVLAFPSVMAVSLAGFYLAIWLILWSLLLRGLSMELGGHIDDPLWRAAWDFGLAASSAALAILFGAALGNVIRGVPLDGAGAFSMALFTDFRTGGRVGILDWYTVSVALCATALLAAHGASFLQLNTTGELRDRSARWATRLWIGAAAGVLCVSGETVIVRPEMLDAISRRPLGWACVSAAVAGAAAIGAGIRRQSAPLLFKGSCALIAGLLGGAAAGLFPEMLHSTLGPEFSLTVQTGASARAGLAAGLVWWPFAFVLAIMYAIGVSRGLRGRV